MKNISIYNSRIKNNGLKREMIAKKLKQNGFQTSRAGELLIVIGGDGTFLSAVQKRMHQNPIFAGFNTGNLGFFSEFTVEEIDDFIRMLKNKNYWIEEIPVYEVHFKDKNKPRIEYFINELVVEKDSAFSIHMGIEVDKQTIGTISGDGVILSTSLGSTGYNMSAKGAISLNHSPFLQITPNAPIFNKSYKSLMCPMLIDDESSVTIFPNVKKKRKSRLVVDGKEIQSDRVRFVDVRKSDRVIRILRSNHYHPIKNVSNKILDFE